MELVRLPDSGIPKANPEEANDRKVKGNERPSSDVFVDLDAQGLKELQVLVVDFKGGIAGQGGYQLRLVGRLFSLLAHPNGGFQYQEDVVSTLFYPGDHIRDLVRVSQ